MMASKLYRTVDHMELLVPEAREPLLQALNNCIHGMEPEAFVAALPSLPESIRLELAVMLNPWRPIEDIPPELKDGREILALIPCYGAYLEAGKLRGYLYAIVVWKYGQWNEVGVGKREPAYFQELDPPPPAEEKS